VTTDNWQRAVFCWSVKQGYPSREAWGAIGPCDPHFCGVAARPAARSTVRWYSYRVSSKYARSLRTTMQKGSSKWNGSLESQSLCFLKGNCLWIMLCSCGAKGKCRKIWNNEKVPSEQENKALPLVCSGVKHGTDHFVCWSKTPQRSLKHITRYK